MPGNKTKTSRTLRQVAWRYTILTHRWIGVLVGLVILIWCLSGIVMMYEQYPELDLEEQMAGLGPVNLAQCCRGKHSTEDAEARVRWFVVENSLDILVLRASTTSGSNIAIDLATGLRIDGWTDEQLIAIGTDYAAAQDWSAPNKVSRIERDQWTVQGQYQRHRPILKFENSDGQNWYVSDSTGQVVQVTSRSERFWNWLGSVPHWLYPTILRQHPEIWSQVVIWLSAIGVFLTLTGIAIGIKQLNWRPGQRNSPYKRWNAWHHYAGLVFGLFTLSWVLSGLFSMNPLGAFESRSFAIERMALNGVNQSLDDVVATIDEIKHSVPTGTVRIESAYWLGEPFLLAYDRVGSAQRFSADGVVANLTASDIQNAMVELGLSDFRMDRLRHEDTYYYSKHNEVELPVFRVSNAQNERLYISETSGRLLFTVDQGQRYYRWLFDAMHRGDFHSIVRTRPLWDILVLMLLLGTTVGVATGTWLGIRRVSR